MNVWKKRMKLILRKTAAILCLICMLSGMCIGQVLGAGNTTITVSSSSAEQDSTVSVAVRLDGNSGLWGLKLRISYDASALALEAVSTGNLFSEGEMTYSESLDKNPYVIVASASKLEDVTGDGVLVTLRFCVKADAELKAYPVTVEVVQAVNVAGDAVSVGTYNGSITVVKCLHSDKQWVTTEAAACEKDGTQVLTCKKCDETFGAQTVPATGHQNTEVRGAVAATQTQTGYSGDIYCTDCGKLVRMGATISKLPPDTEPTMTQPTGTQPTETQPTEPQPTEAKPQITGGNETSFRKDSYAPLIFVSNGNLQDFIRVEVDGVTVQADYYTVQSGSTIVAVSPEYLKTLDVGVHTLSIVSKTGTASASFTVEAGQNPPEESNPTEPVQPVEDGPSNVLLVILIVIIVACVLCAAGVIVVLILRNRRH